MKLLSIALIVILSASRTDAKALTGPALSALVKDGTIAHIVIADILSSRFPVGNEQANFPLLRVKVLRDLYGKPLAQKTIDVAVDLVQENMPYPPEWERALARTGMQWVLYLPDKLDSAHGIPGWSLATAANIEFARRVIKGQTDRSYPPRASEQDIATIARQRGKK